MGKSNVFVEEVELVVKVVLAEAGLIYSF